MWDATSYKEIRRQASKDRAHRVRIEAIGALGGRCERCQIESEPSSLQIIALTEEAKKWSQVVFYRRVSEDPDRSKFSRLLCNKCKFNEAVSKRIAIDNKVEEGTGEFYWIAGQRVEQKRRKVGVGEYEGRVMQVIHPKYDDGQFSSEE